ncbi:DUF3182 family protein [Halomonas sp. Bachu 37]|uniref:DUF3182 family protein n=1 Tax=Halomonas kashgarensis TaxID=3084920 RepID=UPI003217BD8C
MTPIEPSCGRVVVYPDHVHETEHERITHGELAKRLAKLQGLEFAGEYDPSLHDDDNVYFVPIDTITDVDKARRLGIRSEHDLFGGVVPQPFIATKSITHPLISLDAKAPQGWSSNFARQVSDAVFAGFSVFSLDDARKAGAQLLERGPLRTKLVRSTAGRGQALISRLEELEEILATLDENEIATYGLVLEEHIEDIVTHSVGQVRVGELLISYFGTQHLTEDNSGDMVYGGTDLVIVKGGFDTLLALDLPEEIRLAVAQAQTYDVAATKCFPGFFASRRNYDVAYGRDSQGRHISGVLEQSWRIGGASSAEVFALEALRSAAEGQVIRASSMEIYGTQQAPPSHATILFSGDDAQVGPITKCVTVDSYVDVQRSH